MCLVCVCLFVCKGLLRVQDQGHSNPHSGLNLPLKQLTTTNKQQPRNTKQHEILLTALDIATGMEHLHSKQIVHGDLTPGNVLLSTELRGYDAAPAAAATVAPAAAEGAAAAAAGSGGGAASAPAASAEAAAAAAVPPAAAGASGSASAGASAAAAAAAGRLVARRVAKIGDFGLSIKMPEGASHVSNMRQGTPFYVAPEVLRRGNITKASDVYSFGVICWELYHGKRPWKATAARGHVPRRSFPFFAARCPQRFALLAAACMSKEPGARPAFARVRQELLAIRDALLASAGGAPGGGGASAGGASGGGAAAVDSGGAAAGAAAAALYGSTIGSGGGAAALSSGPAAAAAAAAAAPDGPSSGAAAPAAPPLSPADVAERRWRDGVPFVVDTGGAALGSDSFTAVVVAPQLQPSPPPPPPQQQQQQLAAPDTNAASASAATAAALAPAPAPAPPRSRDSFASSSDDEEGGGAGWEEDTLTDERLGGGGGDDDSSDDDAEHSGGGGGHRAPA